MSEITSVLELPIKDQQKLAEFEGLSHEEWVRVTKEEEKENDALVESLDKAEREASLEDKEKARKKYAEFQKRVDSESQGPVTVIWSPGDD